MHYVALASDYDGTLAHDGVVDPPTISALERLRAGARYMILVTGRELDDLRGVMPELELFDRIVAENGAVLYDPATREERDLAEPPPARFVQRLKELRVSPLSVGRVIVATWEPNQDKVLEAIHDLGLELQIVFNKGAVMVLPAGVTKASGLAAALEELDLSPLNCVGVGDAENDMAFLDLCGLSVAVSNALPALKERAAMVTHGARGAGVAELVDRLLETDLSDEDAHVQRQLVTVARTADDEPICMAPQRESLLLAGISGGGKTSFTTGLLERLAEAGFQACAMDPEGDYETLPNALVIGSAKQPPTVGQIVDLLAKTRRAVVVNLLGVPLSERPAFFQALLPALIAERARSGRPHFIVVDEAHHVLPADWDPGGEIVPKDLEGCLFITVRPNLLSGRALAAVAHLLMVGEEPEVGLREFCTARGLKEPDEAPARGEGEGLVFTVADGKVRPLKLIPGQSERRRHRRKYAEGRLGEERSFYFRGPEARLNLQAHNLTSFVELADGVDLDTWTYHRQRGDYSNWIRSSVKDEDLASEVESIEHRGDPPERLRQQIREAVERRYTLPA